MGAGFWMGWFVGMIVALFFVSFVIYPSSMDDSAKHIFSFLVGLVFTFIGGAVGSASDD